MTKKPTAFPTNKKVLQGQVTLEKLLIVARHAFTNQGYANTTTQQIIEQAGVTKGALYHHFPSKLALFEAVYLNMEAEIAAEIAQASSAVEDPFAQLVAGCYAYLAAFEDRHMHRVLRIDGPSVLGYERWAEIDQEHGLDRLLPFLEHLSNTGVITVDSIQAFARLLTGAMNEATFWIAQAADPAAALAESKTALTQILNSVRAPHERPEN